MIAELPWSPLFQALLNGIGSVLAWIYDLVGNFGISIILLTVAIRFVLFPLGMRQIKSMQAMQAIQPKVKELQKKYKSNRQRQQEETMKLYREHGVSPFGSCLPMLLQFPLLVAMYAVVRPPQLVAVSEASAGARPVVVRANQSTSDYQALVGAYEVHNNHLPVDSQLFHDVIEHGSMSFLGMDLQCSAGQAGTSAPIEDTNRKPVDEGKPLLENEGQALPFTATSQSHLDCGSSNANKIPYLLFIALMVGTTFYQQRQMQKVSPPGATTAQTQTLMYLMPALFGFWGWLFPAGLLVYWITANVWQIGQQYVMFRLGHIGPDALEKRRQELERKPASERRGLMANLMERADQERQRRSQGGGGTTNRKPAGGSKPRPTGGSSGTRKSSGSRPGGSSKRRKPGGSSGSSNGKGRPKR